MKFGRILKIISIHLKLGFPATLASFENLCLELCIFSKQAGFALICKTNRSADPVPIFKITSL